MVADRKEYLIEQLYEIGSIKFGEFVLKSSLRSPIYYDMRLIISYPKLLKLVSELMAELIQARNINYNVICGVPYGAISLATSLATLVEKPMILKRKESKAYGTKSLIEGHYQPNDNCLLIEDVVTYGDSILETTKCLRECNMEITDAIVILDREQGGYTNIKNGKVELHSILTSTEVLDTLYSKKKITREVYEETKAFLENNNCIKEPSLKIYPDNFVNVVKTPKAAEMDYLTRATIAKNAVAKRIFSIMAEKKTNLCVAVDVTKMSDLLKVAEIVAPHVCMIKTHVDILVDFDLKQMHRLVDLAKKHNFVIFEDRKFGDIGNTVKMQYSEGIYKISEWSDIVNAHAIAGYGTIKGFKESIAATPYHDQRGCLLVAQMSSQGNLTSAEYTKSTIQMAEIYSEFVVGFITQQRLTDKPEFLHMTPGVQIGEKCDKLGQQYITPEQAVFENKSDVIIVGRGVIASEDIETSAINYKNLAFNSYLKRLQSN